MNTVAPPRLGVFKHKISFVYRTVTILYTRYARRVCVRIVFNIGALPLTLKYILNGKTFNPNVALSAVDVAHVFGENQNSHPKKYL